MSTVFNAIIKNSLDWNYTEINDNYTSNVQTDNGYFLTQETYSLTGTSGYYADSLWYQMDTGVSGGTGVVDLNAITGDSPYRQLLAQPSAIKSLTLENLATDAGANIALSITGTDAFTNIFNTNTGSVVIEPEGAFTITNHSESGWQVDTSQRYLYIVDVGGSGSPYRLTILGFE